LGESAAHFFGKTGNALPHGVQFLFLDHPGTAGLPHGAFQLCLPHKQF
jgi:hypothetical protein